MSGIRTGDWGATWEHGLRHCWFDHGQIGSEVSAGRTNPLGSTLCMSMCGSVFTWQGPDEPVELCHGNGETCERCREIVERAAKGVPQ